MSTVLVLGVKGSPGATTTALLLAGCTEGALLVDADPDGGVLAVRHGLSREPGLSTLAADRTAGLGSGDRHLQWIGDVAVLVGPDHPERASALWARAGSRLADSIRAYGRPTVIDGGRVGRLRTGAPLEQVVDLTVVVARSDTEGLVAAMNLPEDLDAGLIVVDSGPHAPAELAETSGRAVLGTLPLDRRTASAVNGEALAWSRRAATRSPLARSAQTLAGAIKVFSAEREGVR